MITSIAATVSHDALCLDETRVVILTDRQLAGPPRKKKVRFGSFSDFSASVFGTFAVVRLGGGWGSEREVHWCA